MHRLWGIHNSSQWISQQLPNIFLTNEYCLGWSISQDAAIVVSVSWFVGIEVPAPQVSINPFGIQGLAGLPKRYHFVTTAFGRPPAARFQNSDFSESSPKRTSFSSIQKLLPQHPDYKGTILREWCGARLCKLRRLQLLCPRSLMDYMESLWDISSNVFLQSWNLSKYTMSCWCGEAVAHDLPSNCGGRSLLEPCR